MSQLADEMLALTLEGSLSPQELVEAVTEKELEFHQLIFEAAGSEFADRFHELLLQFFREAGFFKPHSTSPDLKGMHEHVRLVQAIAKRDTGRALQVLIEHLWHYSLDPEGT